MKLIVTLGASAGGLAALESFCKELPQSSDCAFVIVQHLSPDFKSLMSQLLAAYTHIPIKQVTSGMLIEKDNIYLIPAGRLMTIAHGAFHLRPRDQEKMPINVFLESAAEAYGNRSVGIIFSGTGSDGTIGCRTIREKGGLVLAQNPQNAEFGSMPQSIVSQGLAHAVVDSDELWNLVKQYDGDPKKLEDTFRIAQAAKSNKEIEGLDETYAEIFHYLKRLFEIDFSLYKVNSVSRRIQRRMERAEISDPAAYKELIVESSSEADALYRDLLIGVTAFFRDPAFFEDLSKDVIEPFFTQENVPDEFRCWVAGCASGEEAYSIAIAADELAKKHRYNGRISIFATDIHKGSVQRAGQGIYTKEEVQNLSDAHLSTYFRVTEDGLFRVKPDMRQRVVFAQHNLIIDPPFTRIDVVTCRNLLIYLKPEVQDSVLRSFLYSLKPKGCLFLGASESLGDLDKYFDVVSSKSKIFKKARETSTHEQNRQILSRPLRTISNKPSGTDRSPKIALDRSLVSSYDYVLKKYAPDGVLINHERLVRHYLGNAGDYCIPLQGRADTDILSMMSGDLKLAVSTGIQRVIKHSKAVKSEGIYCTTRHGEETIDVKIEPFTDEDNADLGLILITFEPRTINRSDQSSENDPVSFKIDNESENRILMLEDELRSAKENLQATVEELQTSNEELQAINEEVQVSNEELQSTNEELHSMNEELYSVNSELEQKNLQLVELNNDHENLLINTEDAILYVDSNLRIKKFNPAIGFAFNLLPQDIGRPLSHIAYTLEHPEEMLRDVQEVIETGIRKEKQARTADGIVYLRRATPFRDGTDSTTGVVLTFTDITEISRMKNRLSRAMEAAGMAWWEWDIRQNFLKVHAEGECILGYDCDEVDQNSQFWFKRVHPEDLEFVKNTLNDCLEGRTDRWSCEHRFARSKSGDWEWVYQMGRVNRRSASGEPLEMSGTTMNIHKRKIMELDLIRAKDAAEVAAREKASFLSTMSHEIRTPMTGVIGNAEILKLSDELPNSLYETVDSISQSGENLLNLINGILDFSRLEAGKVDINYAETDLKKEISSVSKILSYEAKEKSVNLETDFEITNELFNLDIILIKQVILNLVSNAVKFTSEGGTVSLKIKQKFSKLSFSVIDTGIGIEKDVLERLFDPFEQANTSITRQFGGTGLGLSISKNIVQLLGGEIRVESESGKGSTFSFEIPAQVIEEPEPLKSKKVPTTDPSLVSENTPTPEIRLLIIDDNEVNCRVIQTVISRLGYQADYALTGTDGIKKIISGEYALTFLDLHMPGQSGYEVLEELKSDPQASLPVIIAFTADISKSAHDRISQSGFDGILQKPFKKEDVERVIRAHLINAQAR
ncbi:MAG: CheR family methyltransferase [Verrucomicrobiota bacterium]